ncbi:MAG: hypothetical protein AAGC85_14140 [Bacteroidota bacterium]
MNSKFLLLLFFSCLSLQNLVSQEETLSAEEILKKTFELNEKHYILDKPFSLDMKFEGKTTGYDMPYHIEGEGAFIYKKGYKNLAHPLVKHYRNLNGENPDERLTFNRYDDYRVWAGSVFEDQIETPCKSSDGKCWQRNVQAEFLGENVFKNRDVYLVKVTLLQPKRHMLDGVFTGNITHYEAEYTIDKEKWVILKKKSKMSSSHVWNLDKIGTCIEEECKGDMVIHTKAELEKSYAPQNGKYFLSEVNFTYQTQNFHEKSNEWKPAVVTKHEFVVTGVSFQEKFKNPTPKLGLYGLMWRDQAPYDASHWKENSSR